MGLFGRNKIEKVASASMETETPAFSSRGHQPSFNDITVGDMSSGVPRIRVGQMFGSFKRQLKWLIPLLLIGTVAAWHFTKDFKRVYHADGSVIVQLGVEYVYNPIGAETNNSANLSQTPDHITQNEIPLMKNSDTVTRLLEYMEANYRDSFAPELFAKRNSSRPGSDAYRDANFELRSLVDRNFGVSAKPKSSVLFVSYKHEDPDVAVAALKAVIKFYKDKRREIFVEGSGEHITERLDATKEQLAAIEQEQMRFLRRNGISDFASEREGVTKRTEELREALNTLRADISENERALATVENQLRQTPEQINLQIDDRASQRIAQADLELRQLLAKYLPTSEPVRRKQQEIEQLRSLQSSYGNTVQGGRRVGPNTVYQELETRRNTLQSTADALREKEITVQRQLDTADAKVKKLQNLSPQYASLLREQDTLAQRLKDYTNREQEAVINQQQAQLDSDNVRVIDGEGAIFPRKGRNMRALMFVLATLGWGLTLGLIAFMRVFLDPALYVGQQVRGRRSVDRLATAGGGAAAAPHYQDPMVHDAAAAMQHAHIPTPVEAPAAQAYVPDVWQAEPYQAAHAPAAPAYDHNQYAAQQHAPAYTGNIALDAYANPYSGASEGAAYEQAAVPPQPYMGRVPQGPEG